MPPKTHPNDEPGTTEVTTTSTEPTDASVTEEAPTSSGS